MSADGGKEYRQLIPAMLNTSGSKPAGLPSAERCGGCGSIPVHWREDKPGPRLPPGLAVHLPQSVPRRPRSRGQRWRTGGSRESSCSAIPRSASSRRTTRLSVRPAAARGRPATVRSDAGPGRESVGLGHRCFQTRRQYFLPVRSKSWPRSRGIRVEPAVVQQDVADSPFRRPAAPAHRATPRSRCEAGRP